MKKDKIDYTLYLCTDRGLMSTDTLEEAVEQAVRGGCTVVQLREKDCTSLEFYETAKRIKEITDKYQVPLIINDRVDIALAVDADGVHVGNYSYAQIDIVFDFLNDNNVHNINAQDVFQFYPMVHLWNDISKCLEHGLNLVHLTAEPLDVARIAKEAFGLDFENTLPRPAIHYDFRSLHAGFWGRKDYQYSAESSLAAIREYALTEPKRMKQA